MPLLSVTLMLPASATRPDAVTMALLDATWPLLIPIETLVPLGQAAFCEAIWTFHAPSYVAAAAAGVATEIPATIRTAIAAVRKRSMTSPLVGLTPGRSHTSSAKNVIGITRPVGART